MRRFHVHDKATDRLRASQARIPSAGLGQRSKQPGYHTSRLRLLIRIVATRPLTAR
jgi:hypothetical protein